MHMAIFLPIPVRMGGDDDKERTTRHEGGVGLQEKPKTRLPAMHKVLLHNDDYTAMEFVIFLLQDVFHHDLPEATRIMLHVHESGLGMAGVFTREIAETKARKANQMAKQAEFPLQCTTEEV
jgi:ATP-dependent Clp protease adaptor protein ClpS